MSTTPRTVQVLLIEDSETDAVRIEAALKESPLASFAIAHVKTIKEALSALGQQSSHVILLDLELPDNVGLEGLIELHRLYPCIPILTLASRPDKASAFKAVQAGARDYLVKGQIPPTLLQRAIMHNVEHPPPTP